MTDELKTFIDKYKTLENEIKMLQEDKKNLIDDLNAVPKSRWPLDKNAPYMKGPGLKL